MQEKKFGCYDGEWLCNDDDDRGCFEWLFRQLWNAITTTEINSNQTESIDKHIPQKYNTDNQPNKATPSRKDQNRVTEGEVIQELDTRYSKINDSL